MKKERRHLKIDEERKERKKTRKGAREPKGEVELCC